MTEASINTLVPKWTLKKLYFCFSESSTPVSNYIKNKYIQTLTFRGHDWRAGGWRREHGRVESLITEAEAVSVEWFCTCCREKQSMRVTKNIRLLFLPPNHLLQSQLKAKGHDEQGLLCVKNSYHVYLFLSPLTLRHTVHTLTCCYRKLVVCSVLALRVRLHVVLSTSVLWIQCFLSHSHYSFKMDAEVLKRYR